MKILKTSGTPHNKTAGRATSVSLSKRPPVNNPSVTAIPAPTPAQALQESFSESFHAKADRHYFAEYVSLLALLGDAVATCIGLAIAYYMRFSLLNSTDLTLSGISLYTPHFILGTTLLIIMIAIDDGYSILKLKRLRRTLATLMKVFTLWVFVFLSIPLIFVLQPMISRWFVFTAFFCVSTSVVIWRVILYHLISFEVIADKISQRILVIGWSSQADQLYHRLAARKNPAYQVYGYLKSQNEVSDAVPPDEVQVIGTREQLPEVLQKHPVDIVLLADLDPKVEEIVNMAGICEQEIVQFKVIPSFFRIMLTGLHLETIRDIPVLGFDKLPLEYPLHRIAKRIMDFAGAITGLILAAPLILLFGILVYLESPGPVFYRQVRMGRKGKRFKIIKLRSMRLDSDHTAAGMTRRNDPRCLKIGRIMRRLNIDELPQFLNVLLGDMSLVGPRPERPELIEQFKRVIPHYNARHFIKPGITGWAQINGYRGNTDLTKRILCDLYYVENWSPWLDAIILIRTLLSYKNAY